VTRLLSALAGLLLWPLVASAQLPMQQVGFGPAAGDTLTCTGSPCFLQSVGTANSAGNSATLTATLVADASHGPYCLAVTTEGPTGTVVGNASTVADNASGGSNSYIVSGTGASGFSTSQTVNATHAPTTVTATYGATDGFALIVTELGHCTNAHGVAQTVSSSGTAASSGNLSIAPATGDIVVGAIRAHSGATIAPGSGYTGDRSMNSAGSSVAAYNSGGGINFWWLQEHEVAPSTTQIPATGTISPTGTWSAYAQGFCNGC
jgi:hypothetical protein